MAIGGLHGFEEDVFQRIAFVAEAADLYVLVGGDLVQLAHFEAIGQNQFEAALRAAGGLAAELLDGFDEGAVDASASFQFQEAAVGATLLLQIAERGDVDWKSVMKGK